MRDYEGDDVRMSVLERIFFLHLVARLLSLTFAHTQTLVVAGAYSGGFGRATHQQHQHQHSVAVKMVRTPIIIMRNVRYKFLVLPKRINGRKMPEMRADY